VSGGGETGLRSNSIPAPRKMVSAGGAAAAKERRMFAKFDLSDALFLCASLNLGSSAVFGDLPALRIPGEWLVGEVGLEPTKA
jgi:hypothetical protein